MRTCNQNDKRSRVGVGEVMRDGYSGRQLFEPGTVLWLKSGKGGRQADSWHPDADRRLASKIREPGEFGDWRNKSDHS